MTTHRPARIAMPPRRLLTAAASLLMAAVAAGAQEAPAPPEEGLEFAVGTELVRIDVVVTDDDGRPISTLTRDDFVILEDKREQEIAQFEVYSGGKPLLALDSLESSDDDVFPEEIDGYRRRYIVFAIDDVHIDAGNLSQAKQAMLSFVGEQLGPEDEVALVATSGSLGLYQEFSNEPAVLRRAISRIGPQVLHTGWVGTPQISEYQAELIERGDPLALDLAVQEILREEPAGSDPEDAARRVRIRARAIRAESSYIVRTTLETVDGVIRDLAGLPGRKVVILVSDGFLMGIGTNNSQAFDIRRITDAGTRAGVVVYSLDTRGLVASTPYSNAAGRGSPLLMPGVREAMSRQGEDAVRDGMHGLAKDTGGFLVHSTNDVRAGLDKILRDTETYYLMAYQPANTKQDGRFRKIEVRLPGRGKLEVRTRRGYYARDARKAEKSPPKPEEAGQRAANDLRSALGSLYPRSEIPTRLSADFLSLGSAGPQLVVNGNVDLGAVRFRRVGDHHVVGIVIAGVVYDDAGLPVANLEPQRADLKLEPAQYERARKEGLKYYKVLALAPGWYEVRLAVREEGMGRLGSASQRVQIPDLEQGTLTMGGPFLLRADPAEATADSGSAASLQDVQAFPRFQKSDSLYYMAQVLNPKKDTAGETHLTIQAHVFEEGRLQASTPEAPLVLSQMGAVPLAYTGRIKLEPFPPGEYELRVAVTDHVDRSTVLRHVAFNIER